MGNNPLDTNILFITLDSCRFDTASKAKTPFLDGVGKLNKAETNATFTYPAHHAFFIGNLPRLVESDQYFKGFNQIWRSGNARETTKNVFLQFEGKNIIDFYESQGFNVAGFGGVSFFNTFKESNSLPNLFSNFTYFGKSESLPMNKKAPRSADSLSLNNINVISKEFTADKRFMVFVNANETHIPYDIPDTHVDDQYLSALSKLYSEHYGQKFHSINNLPLSQSEIEMMMTAQLKALEWCDKQIGLLLSNLPSNYPTLVIVCGDHGDEFGEGGRFGHAHYHDTVMHVPLWVGMINE